MPPLSDLIPSDEDSDEEPPRIFDDAEAGGIEMENLASHAGSSTAGVALAALVEAGFKIEPKHDRKSTLSMQPIK